MQTLNIVILYYDLSLGEELEEGREGKYIWLRNKGNSVILIIMCWCDGRMEGKKEGREGGRKEGRKVGR